MRVSRDARATEIQRSDERVFTPGRRNPVVLRRNSNALFLLQRVRDEAHRFAITYHRKLRGKERLVPVLPVVRQAVDAYVVLCPYPLSEGDPLFVGKRGKRLNARVTNSNSGLIMTSYSTAT